MITISWWLWLYISIIGHWHTCPLHPVNPHHPPHPMPPGHRRALTVCLASSIRLPLAIYFLSIKDKRKILLNTFLRE